MCESNWLVMILINDNYLKLSHFLNNQLYEHVSKYHTENIFPEKFSIKNYFWIMP